MTNTHAPVETVPDLGLLGSLYGEARATVEEILLVSHFGTEAL